MNEGWRLYLDECVEDSVLAGLRSRGIDAISARTEGRLKETDASHLSYAAEQGRTVLTYDPDIFHESAAMLGAGKHHCGILLALARLDIGSKIHGTLRSLERWTPDEMRDQIRWVASS